MPAPVAPHPPEGRTAPAGSPGAAGSRRALWVVALALGAVLLTLGPTLNYSFVNWDDDLHVYRNPLVTAPADAPLREVLLTPRLGYPIPLTILTYRLEHALFGLRPAAFHATNLLLHLLCCALVYRVGRRLGLSALGGAAALIVFGLHRAVAEPVCWVTGRKDLLAAAFALLACAAWLGPRSAQPAGAARLGGLLALYAASLLSKPVAFLLPLFLALADWVRAPGPRARAPQAARILRTAALPLLLVGVPVLLLGLRGQAGVGALHPPRSILTGLREVWYALGYHLGLLTYVQTPCAKHIPIDMPPPFEPAVDLLPPALALGVGALLLGLRRALRPDAAAPDAGPTDAAPAPPWIAALGLAFAVLMYLPSSNIVPLTRYLADSYLYLPLCGVAWMVGAGIDGLIYARRSAALLALTALALSWPLHQAAQPWRDGLSLWRDVAQRYPDSPEVCLNLGNAWFEAHQLEPARATYSDCARRFGPAPYQRNLAVTLAQLGRREEALAILRRLSQTQPGDPVVQKYLRLLAAPPDR